MEKLESLSKRVSHVPAAEPWDAGTPFPSLEVSNPFPMSDFPQNSYSRLLLPAEHTDSAVLRTAEILTKPDLYKKGNREPPKPQRSRLQVQGYTGKEHTSRGSSRAMPWKPLWDAENQDQHFCSLGTWWDSSGCCDSLWDPKWLSGDQAKEDPDLTAKNYQSGSWGQEVGLSIFLLFLVGCIYLLLLTTPCRYLDAGLP